MGRSTRIAALVVTVATAALGCAEPRRTPGTLASTSDGASTAAPTGAVPSSAASTAGAAAGTGSASVNAAPSLVTSGTAPTVPWHFRGKDPPEALPGPLVEARTPADRDASQPATCRFETVAKESRLSCMSGSELFWRHAWRSRGQTATLLSLPRPQVLVVALYSPVSSGAELRVYDLRTGEERHRTRLQGLGAVSHSEYWNRVELEALPDNVIAVFGNEAAGKYVELVDLRTGRTLSVRRAEEATARAPATPPAPTTLPTTSEPWVDAKQAPLVAWSGDAERVLSLQGITCKLYAVGDKANSTVDGRLGFHCEDAQKSLLVSHETAHASMDAENAVLVDGAGSPTLVVVRYGAMSSGAMLMGYDLKAAEIRYVVPVEGIGPISHSKYKNEIHLATRGANVILYGKESAGSYVEVRDISSGNLIGNRRIQ